MQVDLDKTILYINNTQGKNTMNFLPDGNWPAMITPFNIERNIDFDGLRTLIDFYTYNGSAGLFIACSSGEISALSRDEIASLCRESVKYVAKKVPIVAGIPQCNSVTEQADVIKQIMDEGIDCCIVMASYMASSDDDDEGWKTQIQGLLDATGNTPLGIYECPHPYHRLLTPDTLSWVANTGRFIFHKDTCCNGSTIAEKILSCQNTPLKFYNAHTATLIDSIRQGANGYCGVGMNFYPELYSWILNNHSKKPELSQTIVDFLTESECAFGKYYPLSAKLFLQMRGLNIENYCRVPSSQNQSLIVDILKNIHLKMNKLLKKLL